MNGAKAEPSVRIIKVPKRARKIMIGANHHFLRTFRKSQNSERIESFDMIRITYIFTRVNPSNINKALTIFLITSGNNLISFFDLKLFLKTIIFKVKYLFFVPIGSTRSIP